MLPTSAGFSRITAEAWAAGQVNAAYIKSFTLTAPGSASATSFLNLKLIGQPKPGQPSLGDFSAQGHFNRQPSNLHMVPARSRLAR